MVEMMSDIPSEAKKELAKATNNLVIAKINAPGSPAHSEAMRTLVELISQDPQALTDLKQQQEI